jgi:hypothetical protein
MKTSIAFEFRPATVPVKARTGRIAALAFAIGALLVGLFEAWLTRNDMYSDGISYLDVGDAFFRGDWHAALNAYWSPLYPVLLGGAMSVLKPNSVWQFPVVHLVNWLIFALVVIAFQYLLAGLLRFRSDTLPEWLWIALGYTLFLWATLRLIGVGLVSPDMCVAAFLFLATGVLVRISRQPTLWRYALLGLILGFGYLAKAPMMPIAFVMLSISAFLARGARRAVPRVGLALACLLAVAGPWIYGLSVAKGRPTFGESWSLNVAWYVNDVPRYHWQGTQAAHPTRKIFDSPAAYEFNGPVGGAYPIWYDPAYWNAGLKPHLSLGQMARQIRVNAFDYYELFFRSEVAVAAICLALFFLCGADRKRWILLIPPAAALCMYAPVHVEDRMLGAYVVLLWLGLFFSIRMDGTERRRSAYYSMLALIVLELSRFGLSVLGTAASHGLHERPVQAEIAQALLQSGIHEGSKIAWVRPRSFTPVENYAWARLAKVQIIAEIPVGQEKALWDPGPSKELLTSLHKAGAEALVVTSLPAGAARDQWTPVGRDGYFVRFLTD